MYDNMHRILPARLSPKPWCSGFLPWRCGWLHTQMTFKPFRGRAGVIWPKAPNQTDTFPRKHFPGDEGKGPDLTLGKFKFLIHSLLPGLWPRLSNSKFIIFLWEATFCIVFIWQRQHRISVNMPNVWRSQCRVGADLKKLI